MTDADQKRSFASWKLDWIDALLVGLDAREFRVAACLLQFAGQRDRLIFPSQARIAALLGVSERAVRRAIAQLVTDGWLEAMRPNRHFANSYRFVEVKRDAMIELRQVREAAFRDGRWGAPDGTELSSQELSTDPFEAPSFEKISDEIKRTETPNEQLGEDRSVLSEHLGQDRSVLTGEDRSVRPDRTEVSSNHLKGTPTDNTLKPNVVQISDALRASLARPVTAGRHRR